MHEFEVSITEHGWSSGAWLSIKGCGQCIDRWNLAFKLDSGVPQVDTDISSLFRAGQVLAAGRLAAMFGQGHGVYCGHLDLTPERLAWHQAQGSTAPDLIREGFRAWQAEMRSVLGTPRPMLDAHCLQGVARG